jgi:hypothetical protein
MTMSSAMSIKSILIPALNRPPKRERIGELSQGTVIPRIIHQVGMPPAFENRKIPPLFEKNIEKIKALNPGGSSVSTMKPTSRRSSRQTIQ